MPIQGVVEDTFSIGSPVDMEKYFDFYEKQILDVENLEQTNSPWCVAHAALRDDTHCKTLVLSILVDLVCGKSGSRMMLRCPHVWQQE